MPVPTMLDVDDGRHLPLTERDLGLLQLSTVLYCLHESNPDNGLERDKTDPKAPVSIAAVGMAPADHSSCRRARGPLGVQLPVGDR